VLSRNRADPTAGIEIEKARGASLCEGYIFGFLIAAKSGVDPSPESAYTIYNFEGSQWCMPGIPYDKDAKRMQEKMLDSSLELVSFFVSYLEKLYPTHPTETFAWGYPSFPIAMKKHYPCRKSP
jgi:hypothetical protein